MNTTATGGTLDPQAPFPPDDSELDAIFQSLVTSITGLDGSLVRPRWQPIVPQQPAVTENWCAIGITGTTPDDTPWVGYDSVAETGVYKRHEEIDVLASFYGPNSAQYCRRLRDGLGIPQNLEPLSAIDMAFTECGPMRAVPAQINNQWVKRQDMAIAFRRKITRNYAIELLTVAAVKIIDDTGAVDILIPIPPDADLSGLPDTSSDDVFTSFDTPDTSTVSLASNQPAATPPSASAGDVDTSSTSWDTSHF